MRWEILSKNSKDIVGVLLKNRGIKDKKEFFKPKDPSRISFKSLGVKESDVKKAIARVKTAKRKKEKVVVYGDYDADGICATAIMWEALYSLGVDALPYIPERFSEGYGINAASVEKLKDQTPELKLIITVDNGIVGYKGIEKAKGLGIDVIVIDHHQKGDRKNPAFCILHSTLVSGAALAWFFSRELGVKGGLELASIGTIADQMPLIGVNRSLAKFGLEELNNTKRLGLLALLKDSGIEKVGTYEVNYIIAPRINAMGRLAHGIDSLRLLCTKSPQKASELSKVLGSTNYDRQRVVDEVVTHALSLSKGKGGSNKIIVVAHESYHEGVIGLAAGKLVEEFYRPAIVLSKKADISKASARSISGFNIIEAIRKLSDLYIEGGGHPMAAGFSIETSKIDIFSKKINEIADELLTEELLERKLKIDMELGFDHINWDLFNVIKEFDPTGLGNPTPTFIAKDVEIVEARVVGSDRKHLKCKLKQGEQVFDAIYFGGGQIYSNLTLDSKSDLVYQIEDNTWNGHKNLQLKVKDLKIA